MAGFPKAVTAVLSSLRETTGIDVPQILAPSNGVAERKALTGDAR